MLRKRLANALPYSVASVTKALSTDPRQGDRKSLRRVNHPVLGQLLDNFQDPARSHVTALCSKEESMLRFDVHVPLSADSPPTGLGARVFDAVARMLQGVTHRTHDRPTEMDSSEPLPYCRGRTLLRDDIGLPPLDHDGLPL